MRKTSLGWLLAVAMLTSALWGGVSVAGTDGITEPTVIELFTKGCGHPDATCRVFPLTDADGRASGMIARGNQPLFDADGNVVGRHRVSCTIARGTGWFCSRIETIRPGPHTERGTITVSGLFRPTAGGSGDPSKFDTFAVTGGSGAYSTVRGYATERWDPDREAFAHTYFLTP
jgi:hypothetical protein